MNLLNSNRVNHAMPAYVTLLMLCLNTFQIIAQSDHYWSQNFNTQSSLVAGSVVGGSAGPSAVFYNPALINEENAHQLSLSANLSSGQYLYIKNLVGEGTKTDRFYFFIQPKFLSYTGSSKKNKKITYELAVLTPISKDHRIDFFYEKRLDIIKRLDGMETYTGRIIFKNKYKDNYIGGGLSWKLNDRISVGISGFLSLKNFEYGSVVSMEALPDNDTIYANGEPESYYSAVNSFSEWVKYWDVSIIIKGGIHYLSKNKRIGLGLKLSLPNLHIYGEGRVEKKFKRANVFDDAQNAFTENLDFIGYQEHVLTNVKDPFSIAMGMQYWTKNNKNAITFSAEYFFPVDVYSPMKTRNTPTAGNVKVPDIPLTMSFLTSARGVFNVAIGFIQYFSDRLTIAGGFKTDFNNLSTINRYDGRNSQLVSNMSNLYVDKYHVIVGPSFQIKTFGVTLGVQYTWGRQRNLPNIANFTNPIEFNPETNRSLQGISENNMTLKYNEVSIFFGVSYGFGRKANN
jgi:hypothetical protein